MRLGLRTACLAVMVCVGAEVPQRGGILRVAQRAEPRTFNPAIAVDAPSREIIRRLHADLITINRRTQKVEPKLAESYTVSKDGRELIVRLRPNLKFSDGSPFSVEDVLFSFAVYLDPAVASPQRDLLTVHGKPVEVERLDARSIRFRFAGPYAVPERLLDSIAILPRHKLESAWKSGKLREAWTLPSAPSDVVGLGPFRVKQYKPGEGIVLERNPHYFQAPLPYLDGIEFRLLADEDLQLARYVSGDLDILGKLNAKSVTYLNSKQAPVTDLGPGLDYNFVCFNLAAGSGERARWFANPDFIRALSLAVDRDALVRLVFHGRAAALWGNVSPGNKLWYHADLPRPRRDLGAAAKLLANAGFRNESGRLVDPAGKPVEFTVLVSASSPERAQMASILREDWKALGIDMKPVTLEFRSLVERVLTTRQFDACLFGLGGGDADPNPEMNVWLSSGAMHLWNPNQAQPATAWERDLDELMRLQMTTRDPAKRKKLFDRAQEVISASAPMVFLATPHVLVSASSQIGGLEPAILDHPVLWNAERIYFKTKR